MVELFKREKVGGIHARKIQERYEDIYREYKTLLDLREKNIKFEELDDEGSNDSDERQLLEAYESVTNKTITNCRLFVLEQWDIQKKNKA